MAQLTRGRKTSGCMSWICRSRVVLLMARVAESCVQRVVVVRVTVTALPRRHRMCPRQLEARAGVVKRSIAPLDRIVAGLTRCRETGGGVIHGRDRVRVVILVTRNAGSARQVVIVVDMTISTLTRRYRVCTGKRKPCAAVVKRRIQPGTCVVALVTSLRKVRCNVVRIGRALIVLEMAAGAGVRCQVVVIVDMTIGTLPRRDRMHPRQGEIRAVVIERCVRP